MKKSGYYIPIFFLFIIACTMGQDLPADIEKELTLAINNTINKGYQDVSLGIHIRLVDMKKSLYSRDINKPLMTASAVKIIPSAVALIKLGPDFRFETPLMTEGPVEGGVLKGDLYIKGTGDPSLKISHLKQAVEELKLKGINRISGNIVYDVTFLDEEQNRFAPNARNLYAPPCALTVNYNWIGVNIKNGPPPVLKLIPQTSYAKLDYDVTIARTAEPGRPAMTYRKHAWGDHFTIKGVITGWDKKYKYVGLAASRPGLYAATLLMEACIRAGIRVDGKIRKRKAPVSARALVKMISDPLREIVRVMNQESNNVIAEMLNKDLGAMFLSVPGTRAKGLDVLNEFCMEKLGFKQGEFSLADASGLSRNNRVSARQFTDALNYFYKKKTIRDAFLPTLARQGHHPHAMVPVPPDNIRIHVKTGTLSVSGVNTVVGYIILNDIDAVLSFAILANRNAPGPITYSGTFTNPILIKIVEALKKCIE